MKFLSMFFRGIALIAAAASGVSAYFWFRSAAVQIPDNIDLFITALRQASELNGYAAGAAGITAVCGLILFFRQLGETRFY